MSGGNSGEIRDLASSAQVAWFGLLGFLAFYFLIILTTTDADFFSVTKQTKLPLIDMSVNSGVFYMAAPVVAFVLYLYLHLTLMTLWKRAQRTHAQVLQTELSASLIGMIVLALKRGAQPRGVLKSQTWIVPVGAIGAGLLIWVAQPVVILLSYYASDAAAPEIAGWKAAATSSLAIDQDPVGRWSPLVRGWDTLGAALAPARAWTEAHLTVSNLTIVWFAASALVGAISLVHALAIRQPPRSNKMLGFRETLSHVALGTGLRLVVVCVVVGAAVAVLGMVIHRPDIDIARAPLAGTPAGWASAEARREVFRREWCAERDLPLAVCAVRPQNKAAWTDLARERSGHCDADRTGEPCPVRFATLDRTFASEFLALRKGELESLPELDLEGRDLTGIRATYARLVHARLDGAILGATAADRPDLGWANLEGAVLTDARLVGVTAQSTSFDRANLTRADLTDGILPSASFEGAVLQGAKLDRAELTNAGLEHADLSATVELKPGGPGPNASLESADLGEARLRGARLSEADLAGAILVGADMTGADLGSADLAGADLTGAVLTGADLTGADLVGVVLDGADLTAVKGLDAERLARAVGSDETVLPDGLRVQDCWNDAPPRWEGVHGKAPTIGAGRSRYCAGARRAAVGRDPAGVPSREPEKATPSADSGTDGAVAELVARIAGQLGAGNGTLLDLVAAIDRLGAAAPCSRMAAVAGYAGRPEGLVPALSGCTPAPQPVAEAGPLARLYFDVASDALTPASLDRVPELVGAILAAPGVPVRVVGYADRTGGPARNLALAQARAEAVAAILVGARVPSERIVPDWKDEASGPVTTDDGVSEPMNRSASVSLVLPVDPLAAKAAALSPDAPTTADSETVRVDY